MSKNTVQPVTVLRTLGWVGKVLPVADVIMTPRVVASVSNALILPYPDQPIRTVVQLLLPKLTLPVSVAILNIPHHPRLGQTRVILDYLF